MKQRLWKKSLAVMLGFVLGIQAPFGAIAPVVTAQAQERAATINASSLNVRSGPGTGYSSVTKLARGTAVTVVGETTGSDGKLWYQIRYSGGSGYVLSTYVRFPVTYNVSADFEAQLSSQGFPESYKDSLRQLHAQYPNWIFEAQKTGLDWNTVIENEGVLGRNLVDKNSISSYKSLADGAYNWDNGTWTGFDGSTWVAASQEIVSYYMDPRNFLDEVSVFQFLNHEYDPSVQTREGLAELVKGTFLADPVIMRGSASGSSGGGAVGPGGSSGSGSSGSSNVIVSPSGGTGGSGSVKSPVSGGTSGSPVPGGSQTNVELHGPQASISRHEAERVASAMNNVTVGIAPGAGGSSAGGQSGVSSGNAPASDKGVTVGSAPVSGGTSASGGSPTVNSSPAAGGSPSGGSAPSSGSSPAAGSGVTSGSPVITGGNGSSGGAGPSSAGTSGTGTSPAVTDNSTTYVDIIMKAAQESGVNPYVIAAMIIQEQGSKGQGRSIAGNNSSYPGYYNYFNVGAYAENGMGAVERGLWYASQSGNYGRPWNTPEKSIIGGAQFYGSNYVQAGQNTFYLKKYNVQGSNLYKHQYMTNVDGAASEASLFAEGYSQTLKNMPLRFKIPVYTNMPSTPCVKPTGDGSPNNKLSGLGAEGFAISPAFGRDTESYDLVIDQSVTNVTIYASAIDNKATVSGTGNIGLQGGTSEIRVSVRAQNGAVRDYVIHVIRQAGGPTYNSGIGGGSSAGGNGTGGGSSVNTGGPGMSGGGPGVSGGPGASGSPGGVVSPGGSGTVGTPGGTNVTVVQ